MQWAPSSRKECSQISLQVLANSLRSPFGMQGPLSPCSRTCGNFGVRDTGQIPLSKEQRLLVRSVEIGAVNGTSEIGQEHTPAFQIQCEANSFHQVCDKNL